MDTGQPVPLDHPGRAPIGWHGAQRPLGTFDGLHGGEALGASPTQTGSEPRVEPVPATTEPR
jgi:hypothetical protein